VPELSTVEHWDEVWAGDIRLRLPSPFLISTRNLQRVIKPRVRPRDRFLEIGCAPGKLLAWVAAVLGAEVSGLDYSARGLATCKRLFSALRLTGDLRCEDLAENTLPRASFDVVYSAGFIEHFDDPRVVVRQHVDLVKPGGIALLTVPNYRGVYGRLQRYFDPGRLAIHNLDIMTVEALRALAPEEGVGEVRAYPAGRISPWQTSLGRRWPAPVALGVSHLVNAAALLQPLDVPLLCPMLVLEIRRAGDS
jgi:SAM-dependent methyltransferase